MFTYNRSAVTGVQTRGDSVALTGAASMVTPSIAAGLGGGSPAGGSGGNFGSSGTYLGGVDLSFPLLQDILNVEDQTRLDATYREIYLMDPVSGPVVDMLSLLPWSDYTLAGVEDPKIKEIYESSLQELSIQRLMKLFMASNYVFGRGVGSLVFNKSRGIFTDCVLYNASEAQIIPIPFIGYDPKVNIKLSPDFKKWLNSNDPRDKEAKKELSQQDIAAFSGTGFIELEPLKTIYVERTNLPGVPAVSAFSRILPIWLLEKCLLRGTILSSTRRQKSILHITMGSEDMEYTEEQFQSIAELFANADRDPLGAAVVTRSDVQVNEVRNPSDLWSHSSEEGGFTQAKLRAMGVSDAFMSGDATYSNQENTLNLMMENLRDQRRELTKSIIRDKIFLSLAKYHNFRKRTKAELDHGLRYDTTSNHAKRSQVLSSHVQLQGSRNMADITTYEIPEFSWVKDLKAPGSSSNLGLMKELSEAGVPVPAAMLAAAAGVDLNSMMDSYKADVQTRKTIFEYKEKIKKYTQQDDEEGGGGFRLRSADEYNPPSPSISPVLEPIALVGKAAVDALASSVAGKTIELKPSVAKKVENYVRSILKRR